MATTSKYNWLAIAVIVLAVVNLAFVGYIWLERKEKDKPVQQPKDARDYLIHELNLDSRQQLQFDSLRKGHFEQMKNDMERMHQLKDSFFGEIKTGGDSAANQLAEQIGALQTRIDLNTYHHFAALRSICHEEQKKKFDDIIQNVLRNMGRGPGRADGPPPGDRKGPPPPPEAPRN